MSRSNLLATWLADRARVRRVSAAGGARRRGVCVRRVGGAPAKLRVYACICLKPRLTFWSPSVFVIVCALFGPMFVCMFFRVLFQARMKAMKEAKVFSVAFDVL